MDDTWLIFALGLAAGAALAAVFAFRRPAPAPVREALPLFDASPSPVAALPADVPMPMVLDALEEAVLVLSADKVILLANQPCRTFLPHVPAPVGSRLSALLLDPRIDELLTRCIATGEPQGVETRGDPSGDAIWHASITRLARTDGPPLAILIIRDETERTRTEQVRREFVANASHELRTPLAIVHGYLESLLDGASEDAVLCRRFLETSRRHTERMGRLIEDMLAISKLESGATEFLRPEPFSLADCLARVAEHLASLLDQNKAVLAIDIHPAVASLTGDRFYWEQIFFNLLENALKNNPEPGLHINVTASPAPDGGALIAVADDGIGIPKSALPFIFKRFYRVQKDHSHQVPGTGLGLSIVKRAVEAHGGSIGVESQPGQRTVFTISLPAAAVAPATA